MDAMRDFQRFGLVLNDRVVRTPVAIASMAGVVDADYVLARANHVGVAFIGGYSIDSPAIEAGREMASMGRAEFLYDDPVEELASQMKKMEGAT
jgi:tRNA-dihydrouridine synthase B